MPDIRTLIASLICFSLAGCAPDTGVHGWLDDYVAEVAGALELSPELSGIEPVAQIPRRRERVLDLPELDMGMLDFLSLYGCELQYVVGERNSIMGRVMQPLNQLRYETRFIRAARDCLPEAEREGVKEELEKAIESKSETLSVAVWNATWGVEEIEKLFTLSQGYYPRDGGEAVVAELAADVGQLNQTVAGLLAGNSDEPLDYVGHVHQRWQAEHSAGQLLNSARLLTTRLDDATALLVERIETDPPCPEESAGGLSDVLKKTYRSSYTGSVETYLGSIEQARKALIEPLEKLAAQQFDTMPDVFRDWYRRHLAGDTAESLWQQLERAAEAHDRRWKQLLGQCGVSAES
ncbi:MAG: DUF3080 family protein [Marinobacter sp.]|uniref:DUF3080 family protein n=1 Tax=Marinobacter sp. TaxID=50741 RepID=UPI003299C89D